MLLTPQFKHVKIQQQVYQLSHQADPRSLHFEYNFLLQSNASVLMLKPHCD